MATKSPLNKVTRKKREILLLSTWETKNIVGHGQRPMEFVSHELGAIIERMPAELDQIIDNSKKVIITIETV